MLEASFGKLPLLPCSISPRAEPRAKNFIPHFPLASSGRVAVWWCDFSGRQALRRELVPWRLFLSHAARKWRNDRGYHGSTVVGTASENLAAPLTLPCQVESRGYYIDAADYRGPGARRLLSTYYGATPLGSLGMSNI